MTDRLTPGILRDLARIVRENGYPDLAEGMRDEAARREAEAKELGRNTDGASQGPAVPQGEREGPDSAATFGNGVSRTISEPSPPTLVVEDKPAPAADDTAELARMLRNLAHKYPHERGLYSGADRIEAQAQKLEVQAMEIVEQTNARLSTEARVRELERHQDQFQNAAGKAAVRAEGLEDMYEKEKARADRLAAALKFYANPEIYKPHPHGPAFDRRDLSFHAINALKETP